MAHPLIRLSLCLLLALPLASAHAKRVALVIGNAAYQNEKPLRNPVNDARLLAGVLKTDLKFDDVETVENASQRVLAKAVARFADKAKGAEAAVVYYSGHGMQSNQRRNYLIPVDAKIEEEADLKASALLADELVEAVSEADIKIVILDACRDTPYSSGKKSGAKGLARIPAESKGLLIAYATDEGKTAEDGKGSNSPYASALASNLKRADLSVLAVFDNVADDVSKQYPNQNPTRYGNLKVSAYLSPSPFMRDRTTPSTPAATLANTEQQSWAAAQQADSIGAYQVYLEEYPRGKWARDAQTAIERLKQQQARSAEDSAWQTALQADSAASYQVYLDDYPRGLNASTAKIKLAALKEAAAKQAQEAARRNASPQPGSVFRDCNDGSCPEMVWIPKGNFMMGSGDSESGREKDEGPVHRVDINYELAVSASHITVGQFRQFVSASGHDAGNECYAFEDGKMEKRSGRNWRNPGFAQADDHPVVCINWDDAKAYTTWLSRKTGKNYRLLNESEYEYAARARGQSTWIWGEDGNASCQNGNIADQTTKNSVPGWNWTPAQCNDGYGYTAPIKRFKANGFGLYDMTGNAWSWLEDCYVDSYNDTPSDGSANRSGSCSQRVLRGGSWGYEPQYARVADRGRNYPALRVNAYGFRLARTKD